MTNKEKEVIDNLSILREEAKNGLLRDKIVKEVKNDNFIREIEPITEVKNWVEVLSTIDQNLISTEIVEIDWVFYPVLFYNWIVASTIRLLDWTLYTKEYITKIVEKQKEFKERLKEEIKEFEKSFTWEAREYKNRLNLEVELISKLWYSQFSDLKRDWVLEKYEELCNFWDESFDEIDSAINFIEINNLVIV